MVERAIHTDAGKRGADEEGNAPAPPVEVAGAHQADRQRRNATASRPPTSLAAEADEVISPRRFAGAPSSR